MDPALRVSASDASLGVCVLPYSVCIVCGRQRLSEPEADGLVAGELAPDLEVGAPGPLGLPLPSPVPGRSPSAIPKSRR
jgi:hypothetical protein